MGCKKEKPHSLKERGLDEAGFAFRIAVIPFGNGAMRKALGHLGSDIERDPRTHG